jgi:hypothetical protein
MVRRRFANNLPGSRRFGGHSPQSRRVGHYFDRLRRRCERNRHQMSPRLAANQLL